MRRVILDEGVPKRLAGRLRDTGLDATPFPNSLKQLSNGALLGELERQGFQVLITNDKRMQFQQNLRGRSIAVVVLPTNVTIEVLKLVFPIADAVRMVRAGEFLAVNQLAKGQDGKS